MISKLVPIIVKNHPGYIIVVCVNGHLSRLFITAVKSEPQTDGYIVIIHRR